MMVNLDASERLFRITDLEAQLVQVRADLELVRQTLGRTVRDRDELLAAVEEHEQGLDVEGLGDNETLYAVARRIKEESQ